MADDQIEIRTSGPIVSRIRPPSSKSITNRALICAALADGTSNLRQPLDSEDTRVMVESLQRLGFDIARRGDVMEVAGRAGQIPVERADLFIGNSGTSIRFLTSLVCLGHGEYVLDGVPRMRQRPIQDLLSAVNSLGATARSLHDSGCPPVIVKAAGLEGGHVSVRAHLSSQYLSGLLMAAPYARHDVEVSISDELVSRPYVEMTVAIMKKFGVEVQDNSTSFSVRRGTYQACELAIEPDASAASYFWAAAAITGGEVTVLGLDRHSLQGDVRFCDLLVEMGCQLHLEPGQMTIRGTDQLRGIECDMNDISDTVQTLSAVALFASGPTTIRGVAHNRHKETDRIGNLAIELRKFGAEVDESDDGLRITPPETVAPATIDTYDDHRMAMSLALPGLRVPGVRVNDPGCTSKTYPEFFADLDHVANR